MANLQDLMNLAKADGGKFFVIDETGEARLVILGVDDYQKLLLAKLQRQIKQQADDVEKINKEIIRAQLLEDAELPSTAEKPVHRQEKGPSVSYQPANQKSESTNHHQSVDLRAEVIDPSFDFEGPKVEIDDL